MISVIESQPAGAGMDLVKQVADIFSPTGILSKAKNFEFRPQQQEMAVAVARALQNGEHLAVEAGTGVGKSLAYLIPAILFAVARKKKAVVSTHTINLQEQLTEKDLPMLAQILPVTRTTGCRWLTPQIASAGSGATGDPLPARRPRRREDLIGTATRVCKSALA